MINSKTTNQAAPTPRQDFDTIPNNRDQTMRKSSISWKSFRDPALSLLFGVAAIALAEVAARREWVSSLILPAPSEVWTALQDGLINGNYISQTLSTVFGAGMGLILAVITAVAVAMVFAMIPSIERIFTPYIVGFQSLPKIALAPLILLWLGFGTGGKVTIVVVVCFFPLFVNALQGLKTQDINHVQLMQSLGSSRWQTFKYMRFPGSIPYLFAGLKVAIIFSLVGAIVAEFVGSRSGLGVAMMTEKATFNLPGTFATMFLMLVVGVAFNSGLDFVEKRSGYWGRQASSD